MANSTDRWFRLLDHISVDDGLPVRESGYWAEHKLFFWNRYVEITTQAMVGHPAWSGGVVYVDLFCGPGISIIRESKKRIPGSPLIAANAPKPFSKILLCEIDPESQDACETRMSQSSAADRFQLFRGDCNQEIDRLVTQIPNRALTLGFLDPTGLHHEFETVSKLAQRGQVDLLILFPDAQDIIRNVDHHYLNQLDSKLDRYLGPDSEWRQRKASLQTPNPNSLRKLFAEIYINQLRVHAGYSYFGKEVIIGPTGPLYSLIFATKHERGLDFWEKSVKKESGGQKRLF